MATTDKRPNFFLKRFLSREDLRDFVFGYLKKRIDDNEKYIYQGQGIFSGAHFSASNPDTFNISPIGDELIGIDQNGNWLETEQAHNRNVPFENANGVDYHVGFKYAEVPSIGDVVQNERSGLLEYNYWVEAYGELGQPDSVEGDATYDVLTIVVDSLFEAGVSNAGRKVVVMLQRPAAQGSLAYEICDVLWDGVNNYIETTHDLGQMGTYGAVSEDAADYLCWAGGATVRRNTNLSTDGDYIYCGTIQGRGSGLVPNVWDESGQRRINSPFMDNSLDIDTLFQDVYIAGLPRPAHGNALFNNPIEHWWNQEHRADNDATPLERYSHAVVRPDAIISKYGAGYTGVQFDMRAHSSGDTGLKAVVRNGAGAALWGVNGDCSMQAEKYMRASGSVEFEDEYTSKLLSGPSDWQKEFEPQRGHYNNIIQALNAGLTVVSVGDGVESFGDFNGNDFSTIQDAIDACFQEASRSGFDDWGGIVHVKRGHYEQNTNRIWLRSNIHLVGDGAATVLDCDYDVFADSSAAIYMPGGGAWTLDINGTTATAGGSVFLDRHVGCMLYLDGAISQGWTRIKRKISSTQIELDRNMSVENNVSASAHISNVAVKNIGIIADGSNHSSRHAIGVNRAINFELENITFINVVWVNSPMIWINRGINGQISQISGAGTDEALFEVDNSRQLQFKNITESATTSSTSSFEDTKHVSIEDWGRYIPHGYDPTKFGVSAIRIGLINPCHHFRIVGLKNVWPWLWGAYDFTIERGRWQSDYAQQWIGGTNDVTRVIFKDCVWDNTPLMVAGIGGEISQVIFDHCLFTDDRSAPTDMLMELRGDPNTISHVKFVNGTRFYYPNSPAASGEVGLLADPDVCDDLTFHTVRFDGAGVDILGPCWRTVFSDCKFIQARLDFGDNVGSDESAYFLLDNCLFYCTSITAQVTRLWNLIRSQFTNNRMTKSSSPGLLIYYGANNVVNGNIIKGDASSGAGIYMYNHTNLTIGDNIVANTGTGGGDAGIEVNTITRLSVVGNICTGADYGINYTSVTDGEILGNTMTGNAISSTNAGLGNVNVEVVHNK